MQVRVGRFAVGRMFVLMLWIVSAVAAANPGYGMRPYVTTSADGRFYFRMLPAVNQLPARGYCFEVTDGPEDRLLWQTGGWYAESVLVATDGQHVAVDEQGRATLYSGRSRAPIVVQLGAGDGVASMPLAESGLVLTLPHGGTWAVRFGAQPETGHARDTVPSRAVPGALVPVVESTPSPRQSVSVSTRPSPESSASPAVRPSTCPPASSRIAETVPDLERPRAGDPIAGSGSRAVTRVTPRSSSANASVTGTTAAASTAAARAGPARGGQVVRGGSAAAWRCAGTHRE